MGRGLVGSGEGQRLGHDKRLKINNKNPNLVQKVSQKWQFLPEKVSSKVMRHLLLLNFLGRALASCFYGQSGASNDQHGIRGLLVICYFSKLGWCDPVPQAGPRPVGT